MCIGLVLLIGGCQERNPPVVTGAVKAGQNDVRELIAREPVDDDALKRIGARSNLEVLELHQVSCSADALARCIQQLPRLKALRVEGMVITSPTLVAVSQLRELEVLNLPTADFNDETLAAIARMPKLQLLRFGSSDVTDRGLSLLNEAPALRFLHLLNVPITDVGLQAFHDMSQLESFYIDGGNETDEGIQALLKANPTIHFHRNQLHVPDDPNADNH